MQTVAGRKEWTDEELMALPRDGGKYELLGGELIVSPTGFQHGYTSSRLMAALVDFSLKHRLGLAVDSSTGFRLPNGDCLSPDASFVSKEHLRQQTGDTTKFFQGAPDLAVEVISPRENRRRLRQKLAEYFANGTRLAWLVNPKERTVLVYDSPEHFETMREAEHLNGGTLLPGFTFPIRELFDFPNFDS